jgi:hypothetical protein
MTTDRITLNISPELRLLNRIAHYNAQGIPTDLAGLARSLPPRIWRWPVSGSLERLIDLGAVDIDEDGLLSVTLKGAEALASA